MNTKRMQIVKVKKLYHGGADVRDYVINRLVTGEILRVEYQDEYIELTKEEILSKMENYPKTPIKSIYGTDYILITIPWRNAKITDSQLDLFE